MRHATWQRIIGLGAAIVLAAGAPRAAGAGASLPADAQRAAVKCQAAVTKRGLTFVGKKLKLLDRCADAAFECVHLRPGDAGCLEKAESRCAKAIEKIAQAEADFAADVVDGCAALDPASVLAAFGLGYETIAAECSDDFGIALSDTAAVAACLVRHHECLAERLFQAHQPRAAELLELVGADLGPETCLEDFGGTGEPVGDPALAKALDKCEGAIRKAGTGFVVRKLKNASACARELVACALLENSAPACFADADGRCDGAFAKTEAQALKLGAAIARRCAGLPVAVLTAANGLGADLLLDVCADLGVFGIGSVNDYGNCVVRQHECDADDLLRVEVPRAGALLAEVGRTLPGGFFCSSPTPTPSASPTPSPSPTP